MWYDQTPNQLTEEDQLWTLFRNLGLDSEGGIPNDFWNPLFPDEQIAMGDHNLPVGKYGSLAIIGTERLLAIKSLDLQSRKLDEVFFHTTDGRLGTTFGEVCPGDLVCVISGSNLPVIFRKVNNHYLHIGTSFVLGLMDGEAMKDTNNGSLGMEEFDIH